MAAVYPTTVVEKTTGKPAFPPNELSTSDQHKLEIMFPGSPGLLQPSNGGTNTQLGGYRPGYDEDPSETFTTIFHPRFQPNKPGKENTVAGDDAISPAWAPLAAGESKVYLDYSSGGALEGETPGPPDTKNLSVSLHQKETVPVTDDLTVPHTDAYAPRPTDELTAANNGGPFFTTQHIEPVHLGSTGPSDMWPFAYDPGNYGTKSPSVTSAKSFRSTLSDFLGKGIDLHSELS